MNAWIIASVVVLVVVLALAVAIRKAASDDDFDGVWDTGSGD